MATPQTRTLQDHMVNQGNDKVSVRALDEPGGDGASCNYEIGWGEGAKAQTTKFQFQRGTPQEQGTNGLTPEALLTIVADRFRGLQQGPMKGRPYQQALEHIEQALTALTDRNYHGREAGWDKGRGSTERS